MAMLYYAFGTKEDISGGIFSPLPNHRIRGDQPNVELDSSQRFRQPLPFFSIFTAFFSPGAGPEQWRNGRFPVPHFLNIPTGSTLKNKMNLQCYSLG